ncbi:MAG: PAC2 family protein [Actinomycetota bacterium]|nr:PAC2 family protein [Actinomycetota bacterium]
MLDPAELFTVTSDLPDLDRPVLVQALEGFVDAGGARRLAAEHLLATSDPQVVVTFDVDQLFDYRARRPEMVFATDHWASYADPKLEILALRDGAGTPFLLLAGPEPDVQWERFVAAIRMVVDQLGVRMSIGLNAIPMAVPHTRPAGVIAHASRNELIPGYDAWVSSVQVPASAGHLMEYRLGQGGVDAAGFAVNVPHYVAQIDYPAAAVTLLECVARTGGLVLPTGALEEAARTTRASIDEQVSASDEVASVVRALEAQYDAFLAGTGRSLVAEGSPLPSADEIAAEFEHYLSQQPGAGEPPAI